MDRVVLWCASGVISCSAYIVLILLLLFFSYTNKSNPLKFASQKEIEFQVTLDIFNEPKVEDKILPPTQQKTKVAPKKENVGSKTPVAGVGIKKMFDAIPDKVAAKNNEEISDNRDTLASRKKGDFLSYDDKLQENLQNILSQINVKQMINFTVQDGEYNEYYAKIDSILSEHWKNSKYRDNGANNTAEVLISIDDKGRFRYRVQKKSGDIDFDRVLDIFLEDMTLIAFPPYIHSSKRETSIIVTIGSQR